MKKLLVPAAIALCGSAFAVVQAGTLYKQEYGPHIVDVVEHLVLTDADRGKDLQLRVTYPREDGTYPLVIFSHGANGSKDFYQPLIQFWASHGYVLIQPNHSDSQDLDPPEGALGDWENRPADVSFIIDSLGNHLYQYSTLQLRIHRVPNPCISYARIKIEREGCQY